MISDNKNRPAMAIDDPDKAHRLLASISQIGAVISAKRLNYRTRMEKILSIILAYLGVEQGSIMVLDSRKRLVVKAASRPELVGHRQPIDEKSVAGWVAVNRTPLFIPDISKDNRFPSRGRDAYKKNSLLSAPIMHEKRLIGVINVTDKTASKDFFKDDIAYLLEFSSMILWLVEQQNLLDSLKKHRNTLKKKNQELRRQESLRAELDRMLIHDLKGPLSEVVANLDILSYSIADEHREFLEAAQMGCDRAVHMASNLATVNIIEDGKMQLLLQEVTVDNLLEESVSAVKGLARMKSVALKIDTAADLPSITLDRTLILRVLQNLLTNALSYSPADTVISVACRVATEGLGLEFSISDQGPGIPPGKRGLIFEKYSRLAQGNETDKSGLGLYFCRLAVAEHGGTIGVTNNPRGGSRFHFTLPLTS